MVVIFQNIFIFLLLSLVPPNLLSLNYLEGFWSFSSSLLTKMILRRGLMNRFIIYHDCGFFNSGLNSLTNIAYVSLCKMNYKKIIALFLWCLITFIIMMSLIIVALGLQLP